MSEPAPRVFERWGYTVREARDSEFVVRGPNGTVIGWITVAGIRFQARGFAQSLESSEVIGTFESVKAALALVIGHFDMLQLRDRVSAAVRRYEAEGPTPMRARATPDRSPSAGAPRGTPGQRQPPSPTAQRRPRAPDPRPESG
jgi:hypothetical protein